MSALVVTVLIVIVWATATAVGYVRGGWREVVTLAGLLLSGAMLAEWAAPNGADLAGLFDGDVYRSSTFIAFLYLIGGTLLLGYFGGSRLPRPASLSTTERFVGGALGFFNGGLLTALALRTLRATTFRPGDGAVLAETPLADWLAGNAGYLIAVAMLAGAVAPFVSAFLLRGPRYAAEYAEEPSLAAAPYTPDTPRMPDVPQEYPAPPSTPTPGPAFVVPFTPPPAVAYVPSTAPAIPPPGAEGRSVSPPGARVVPPRSQPLIPAAPMIGTAAAAATLPTPALPPAPPSNETPTAALAVPPPHAEVAESVPAPHAAEAWVVMPPGFDITASQPLPTVAGVGERMPEIAEEPDAFALEAQRDDAPTEGEPDTRPPPVALFPPKHPSSSPTDTDGLPIVLPPDAHEPDDLTRVADDTPEPDAIPTDTPVPFRDVQGADTALVASPSEGATTANSEGEGEPDAAPRVARARVAAVRQPPPPPRPLHMTVPPELQRPVQPGPQMHPCPVCDYPVRNEARFCPNCGTAQPVSTTYRG